MSILQNLMKPLQSNKDDDEKKWYEQEQSIVVKKPQKQTIQDVVKTRPIKNTEKIDYNDYGWRNTTETITQNGELLQYKSPEEDIQAMVANVFNNPKVNKKDKEFLSTPASYNFLDSLKKKENEYKNRLLEIENTIKDSRFPRISVIDNKQEKLLVKRELDKIESIKKDFNFDDDNLWDLMNMPEVKRYNDLKQEKKITDPYEYLRIYKSEYKEPEKFVDMFQEDLSRNFNQMSKRTLGELFGEVGATIGVDALKDAGYDYANKQIIDLLEHPEQLPGEDAQAFFDGGYKQSRFYSNAISGSAAYMGTVAASTAINPAAGFVAASSMIKYSFKDELIEAGVDLKTADNISTIVGMVGAAIESIGGFKIGKMGEKGFVNYIKNQLAKNISVANIMNWGVSEGVEEIMQGMAETFGKVAAGLEVDFKEEAKGWLEGGIVGFVMGLGLSGGGKYFQNLYQGKTSFGLTTKDVSKTPDLVEESKRYKSADEFYNTMPIKLRDELRTEGIKGEEAIKDFWNKKVISKEPILDNLNPTGSLYVDYTPNQRATMELGENITTLAKTSKKSPDTMITIYRGAPKNQKQIVAGDFITTNYDLAKSYIGEGNILSKKVEMSDVLDDITEPLGEEYIYRPKLPEATTKLSTEPLAIEAKKKQGEDMKKKEDEINKRIENINLSLNEDYEKIAEKQSGIELLKTRKSFAIKKRNDVIETFRKIIAPEGLKKEPKIKTYGNKVVEGIKKAVSMPSYIVKRFIAGSQQYDTFIDMLDEKTGAKRFQGQIHNYISEKVERMTDTKMVMDSEDLTTLQIEFDKISKTINKKREVDGKNYLVEHLIKIYLASKDKDQMRAMTEGNNFSKEFINNAIASLSEEEKAFGDYNAKFWLDNYNKIAEVVEYVEERTLLKVKGYSPKGVEYLDSLDLRLTTQQLSTDGKTKVDKRQTKSRTGTVAPITFNLLEDTVNSIIRKNHYLSHEIQLNELGTIIGALKPEIRQEFGDEHYNIIRKWLEKIASDGKVIDKGFVGNISLAIRKGYTKSLIANIVTGVKQTISLSAALQEINEIELAKGITSLVSNPKGWIEFFNENLPQMKNRSESMTRDIKTVMEDKNAMSKLSGKKSFTERQLFGILGMDKTTVLIVAVSKYTAEGGTLTGLVNKKALSETMGLIRRTQPSGLTKDLSLIQQENWASKLLTMFMNQPTKYLNNIYGAARAVSKGREGSGIAFSRALIYSWVVPSVAYTFISSGGTADEEDYIVGLITAPFSYMLLISSLANAVKYGFDFKATPIEDLLGDIPTSINKLEKGEFEESGVLMLETYLKFKGVAINQMERTYTGVKRLQQGKGDWRDLIWSDWALKRTPLKDSNKKIKYEPLKVEKKSKKSKSKTRKAPQMNI